jgi:hypothetical protein
MTLCVSACSSFRSKRQLPVELAARTSANWRDRDSTVAFEKFLLPPDPPAALVVVYGSTGGSDGILVADTVSYVVPASGILHVQRKIPVPWAETHLYRSTPGTPIEIPVAADCALHRIATQRYPGGFFGCWMPLVISGSPPNPYMAVALSDSAGLAKAFNHAMELINSELFSNHLHPVPRWVEPNDNTQHNPLPPER